MYDLSTEQSWTLNDGHEIGKMFGFAQMRCNFVFIELANELIYSLELINGILCPFSDYLKTNFNPTIYV